MGRTAAGPRTHGGRGACPPTGILSAWLLDFAHTPPLSNKCLTLCHPCNARLCLCEEGTLVWTAQLCPACSQSPGRSLSGKGAGQGRPREVADLWETARGRSQEPWVTAGSLVHLRPTSEPSMSSWGVTVPLAASWPLQPSGRSDGAGVQMQAMVALPLLPVSTSGANIRHFLGQVKWGQALKQLTPKGGLCKGL